MAAHVVTKGLSRLCCCPSSPIYDVKGMHYVRFYGLQHKMTKDERHELAEYRRKVTELRKQFKQEWTDKEKMKEEASSVQAAELAALERRKEKEALEENEKEIERMKKWREEKMAKLYLIKEEKRKQSEITRKMKETEKLQEKTTEVQHFIDASTDFITMENLDAKLEEAVEMETNVNYALRISGEKLFDKKL